jgi:hypothetical protein
LCMEGDRDGALGPECPELKAFTKRPLRENYGCAPREPYSSLRHENPSRLTSALAAAGPHVPAM